MTSLSNFDLRQLRLIAKKIFLFERKEIDLSELIVELSAIFHAFEHMSDSWKTAFQSKINFLEIFCDSMEDGSIIRWKGNFQEDLDITIVDLKHLITIKLDEYIKSSDPNIIEVATEGDPIWLICPHCNEAWESSSTEAMVICPKCEHVSHNPRFQNSK